MNPEEKLNRLRNGITALGKMLDSKGLMEGDIQKIVADMLKLIRTK